MDKAMCFVQLVSLKIIEKLLKLLKKALSGLASPGGEHAHLVRPRSSGREALPSTSPLKGDPWDYSGSCTHFGLRRLGAWHLKASLRRFQLNSGLRSV